MKGLLITFEGIEGSGKSTQILRLSSHLTREGFKVLKTREPGGTPLGEQIRQVLLSVKNHSIDARTELLLYLASRAQHVEEVILPALEEGKIILCDRFSDATMAYQCFGRGLPRTFVGNAIKFASNQVSPDLTLLLDLEVRLGLSRVRGRGPVNRLDREGFRFHQRVRDGYLKIAHAAIRRFRILDAGLNPEEMENRIKTTVFDFLKKRKFKPVQRVLMAGRR